MTKRTPWYREGLRFECTQCGACCSGEPGYVFVSDDEIQSMADRLQMAFDAFERKFVRMVGTDKSLVEYPDGDCIFLDPDSRHCLVYEQRPIQCRTWPFWDSTLEDEAAWEEACDVCPGSGVGRLYTIDEIETRRTRRSV